MRAKRPPLRRVTETTRRRAQSLRNTATKPEVVLWGVLNRRQLGGLKFRRQHPIEPFIVDFYCAERRLIVELDGNSHIGRSAEDERRIGFLRGLGFHVLRFGNDDVFHRLQGVVDTIRHEAERLKPLPRREELGEGLT